MTKESTTMLDTGEGFSDFNLELVDRERILRFGWRMESYWSTGPLVSNALPRVS